MTSLTPDSELPATAARGMSDRSALSAVVADVYNTPQFQPVVRLVRLPLEFFLMQQQTPQPVASSSSVSISDPSKRFANLLQLHTRPPAKFFTAIRTANGIFQRIVGRPNILRRICG